tara:strand:+ start:42 stop:890 length:849 start_codon:yes stop_codon:yes gene_type:complete
MMNPLTDAITNDVRLALQEDVRSGDVTGALIPINQTSQAHVLTRENMVLSGKAWFDAALFQLDALATVDWLYDDGDSVESTQVLCRIKANSRALLAAERVALNFLQLLSGVATQTHAYAQKITSNTKLLDTRKTLPNLRAAQKYAVTCGGGVNHRFGLYDAYLIKENHIKACGSIKAAVLTARKNHPELIVEVEVESLEQLDEALACSVDRIMLDNFSIVLIQQAIERRGDKPVAFEASGNVSLETIAELSHTGVDFISVGALTKSVIAVDLSLLVDDVFDE